MNLEDIRQGNTVPGNVNVGTRANQEWWQVDSGLNLSTFGYPDNFADDYPFYLYFYIDKNVKQIIEVGLAIRFMKFRGYTKSSAHHHTVTIPNHTHTVTIPDHHHTITGKATAGDDTPHQHTVVGQLAGMSIQDWLNADPGSPSRQWYIMAIDPLAGTGLGNCSSSFGIGGQIKLFHHRNSPGPASGESKTFKTVCTNDQHTHPITGITTDDGGGSVVTTSAGGGTVVTTSDAPAVEFGILEDSYPSNVHVIIDGVDITSQIGGPFNPDDSNNFVRDLDITPYVREGGIHELKMTSDTRGRVLPLLWVKSIISR